MTGAAVDALLEAVDRAGPSGISAEGLHVARTEAGYQLRPPGSSEERATDGRPTGENLSEQATRDALSAYPAYVREWYHWTEVVPDVPHGVAFLRWLEGAKDHEAPSRQEVIAAGVHRHWGQLRIAVGAGADGGRAYEVRHVDDADADVETLATHREPVDMRDIGRTDADGNYRPLATAPTLRPGWVFPDLGPADLLEVVDRCYPATVPNWYRERAGDLDVTHWRETAARQTGIYDLVEELDGEAVTALARACCVDSQCLKRREWDEYASSDRTGHGATEAGTQDGATADREAPAPDADTDDGTLDAPRGDGEFPCREPCSLVVAAAREFVRTERESTAEVTLGLRPRELEQLRSLLDAAAEGDRTSSQPGDLPDPANRLRVRYLRERLRERGSPLVRGAADPADDGAE